jgi:DNA-binding CsgD family transcriptional regulator
MLRQTEARDGEPDIFTLIAAAMCGVTECSRSAVFVLDAGHGVLHGTAAYGFPFAKVATLEKELHDVPLAAAALHARAPARCLNEHVDRCLPRSWIDELRLADPFLVPLISGSDPVAFVLLDRADVSDQAWPEAREKAAAYASVAADALRTHLRRERKESAPPSTTEEPVLEPNRVTPVLPPDEHAPVRQRDRQERALAPDRPKLTDQELKVIRFVADGLTNREIGTRLGLSRHTVKEYLSHAMRKLEAVNRVDAVRRAGTLGLLDGTETPSLPPREEVASASTHHHGEVRVESSDLKVPAVKLGRREDTLEP